MTGDLQRALTDEWQTQAQLITATGIPRTKWGTVEACLTRLVSEGRAEYRMVGSAQMMGGRPEFKLAGGNHEANSSLSPPANAEPQPLAVPPAGSS